MIRIDFVYVPIRLNWTKSFSDKGELSQMQEGKQKETAAINHHAHALLKQQEKQCTTKSE